MRLPFRHSTKTNADQAVAKALDRIGDRLDRLIATAEQTNLLLGQLQPTTQSPTMTPQQSRSTLSTAPKEVSIAAPAPKPSRATGRTKSGRPASPQARRQPTPSARPLRLHEAIILVLEDAGQPLTANDVAARIRERDLFQPPRSVHELRGGQVSARVGNATYRDRFVRRGGLIGLPDSESDQGSA